MLLSIDHRQVQRGIALLLSDRRQDVNAAIFDFENSLTHIPLVVSNREAMQPFDADFLHFIRDRMRPVSGQTVDTGSHEEMRSHCTRRAKKAHKCRSRDRQCEYIVPAR